MTTHGQRPVRFALIGAGRIGTHHATALARHVPDAELVVVADPFGEAAQRLAGPLGLKQTTSGDVCARPGLVLHGAAKSSSS